MHSVSELTLARAIAAAVRTVPGVADLSPGRFAEVATYRAGDKVPGVVVKRGEDALEVEVHVCARYADSLALNELATRVRETTRQSIEASGTTRISRIDVAFDDISVE
jgi:uncharacterized alkaline shock family protein YloU